MVFKPVGLDSFKIPFLIVLIQQIQAKK
jgi:hypothetical protein